MPILQVKDTLHKSLTRVHADDTMILCWKGPKKFRSIHEVKPLFKSIFLVFDQGNRTSNLEIAPENYLIISVGTQLPTSEQQVTIHGSHRSLKLMFLCLCSLQGHKNVCFGILPHDKLGQTTMILGGMHLRHTFAWSRELGPLDHSTDFCSSCAFADITMQDRIVIYDNEGSQIGWAHHSC